MPEKACLHALVHGTVQGVFFREYTRRQASALGLTGYVRNLPDGYTVEVVAEGERPTLEQLLSHVRRGPPEAHVERVDVTWSDWQGDFPTFSVQR